MTKSQKAQIEAIKAELETNDKALCAGLLVIYGRQTGLERAYGATTDLNGRGFTGCDAEILTSFAQQYERKGWLSVKQIALLRKKMGKYAAQLIQARLETQPEAEQAFDPSKYVQGALILA